MSLQNNNPKYLAFFGTCKMWDNSWKQLEHPDLQINLLLKVILKIGGV